MPKKRRVRRLLRIVVREVRGDSDARWCARKLALAALVVQERCLKPSMKLRSFLLTRTSLRYRMLSHICTGVDSSPSPWNSCRRDTAAWQVEGAHGPGPTHQGDRRAPWCRPPEFCYRRRAHAQRGQALCAGPPEAIIPTRTRPAGDRRGLLYKWEPREARERGARSADSSPGVHGNAASTEAVGPCPRSCREGHVRWREDRWRTVAAAAA